ncbi:hypothetical protein K432DRAFT_401494 [Lepidopterella palustris CBS 459.81]|uniref:C2H2-type domain-containing protein n=1 Tax=Lepidopterella palustris CBS 459.81 TaxID=1314670 RepID=A0A8E2EHC8_9PEZI|nr:hypothetical protein K432DRAFT_401494 [Lepidopterella palustris CBS 459.81]
MVNWQALDIPAPTEGSKSSNNINPQSINTGTTIPKPNEPAGANVSRAPGQHLPAGPRNYCNICQRGFKDRNGLQNHVDHAQNHQHACKLCLITFASSHDLNQHLRRAPQHVLCKTCNRKFSTQSARDEHWEKTAKHRHCMQPRCDFDAQTDEALAAHTKTVHFPLQCGGCGRIFPSRTKLVAHFQANWACLDCGAHNQNEHNLNQHMLTHAPADLICWGCDRSYRTISSMFLHFESGICSSLVDLTEFNKLLATWYRASFIHADYRGDLSHGKPLKMENGEDPRPFLCHGCPASFGQFSALVQHLEGVACGKHLQDLKLEELEALFRDEFVDNQDGGFSLL